VARLGFGLRYARRFMSLFRAAAVPDDAAVGSTLTALVLRDLCFHRLSTWSSTTGIRGFADS
jgi:hypothetical protein